MSSSDDKEQSTQRDAVAASARQRVAASSEMAAADVVTVTVDGTPPSVLASGFPVAWDRYAEAALLGAGGMGQVFKAWDPRLKRYVALKFLARFPLRGAERFLAEAQLQARVEHEHICKVYEVGDADGRPYIAMQFIDGTTLSKAATQMSLADHVHVVRKVADAVHAAHAQGLIHRDLKPANIMVEHTEKGFRPTVLDFGIARELGSENTKEIAGTPAYMSPEQLRGEVGDRRVDVWGLGMVLHTLLAGGPPASTQLPSTVPADLRAITQKCLHADPENRYPSAAAVAEDLRRFLDGEPISAHPPSLLYRAGKRLRRNKALAAVAALAVIAVGVLGGLALYERRLAGQRVALAQRFGQKVARLEMHMRQAYGAPLHDVRRERKLVLAQMAAIDEEARSLGDIARGPAAYAIGRTHLSLHDWDNARTRLDEAWRGGYRSPELSYALGLALGQKYQQALVETRRLTDKVQRERAQAQLRRTLRDPALEHLRAARGADLETPAYVEGLIAFYEGDYTRALAKAEAAFEVAPWLYEARVLEGDVHTTDATERLGRGDYDGARVALAAGAQAYAVAEALAPSDAALLEAECERRRIGMSLGFATGKATAEEIDDAVAPCGRAHIADPEQAGPLVREARILSTSADFFWTSRGVAPEPLVTRAIARAEAALAVQPGLAQAWYGRANSLSIQGRAELERGTDPRPTFDAANESFEKAIALDTKLAGAYADACITYQYLSDWLADQTLDPRQALDRAVAVGERGIAADPGSVHARRAVGTAWLRRGMWEAERNIDPASSFEHASKAYAAVLAINPNDAATINNEAMVRETVGAWRLEHGITDGESDLDRAEVAYQQALRHGGESSDTLNNLGHLCLLRSRHALRVGRDVRKPVDAGLAYLARAQKSNANEVHVYFNAIQLHLILGEAALIERTSPTPMIEAALAAIEQHRRVNATDVDIDAFEAEAHILAARAASAGGRDPSLDFTRAEKALARAAKNPDPTSFMLVAQTRLHRYRAEWLLTTGRSVAADLAAGDSAIDKLLAMEQGMADARLLRGTLGVVRARAARDPSARRKAGETAKAELAAAVKENRFLEREGKPLIAEAETLAR